MDYLSTSNEKLISNNNIQGLGMMSQLERNIEGIIDNRQKLDSIVNTGSTGSSNKFNYQDYMMHTIYEAHSNEGTIGITNNKVINALSTNQNNITAKDQNISNNGILNDPQILNNNHFYPLNASNPGGHQTLSNFNEILRKEEQGDKKEENQLNITSINKEATTINEKAAENDNYTKNEICQEIIAKLTENSDDDSRMKDSKFLSFLKDISDNKLQIDDINNTMIENRSITSTTESKMNQIWNNILTQTNSLDLTIPITQHYQKAVELFKSHESTKSIPYLQSELQNNPENAEALYILAKIYMDNNRDDLAITYAEKSGSIDSFISQSHLLLSGLYTNEGDEFKSLMHIKKYLKLTPKYSKLYNLYIKSNPFLSDAALATKLDPDTLDFTSRGKLETFEYDKKQTYDELIKILGGFKEEAGQETDGDHLIGGAYMMNANYNEAITAFTRITELNAMDYSAWNRLGVLYANGAEGDKANEMYNKALSINANYTRAYANMGISYGIKEDYINSARSFIKALNLFPDNQEIWNYGIGVFVNMEREDLVNKAMNKDLRGVVV